MRTELLEALDAVPFTPFVIHLSDGRTLPVRYAEQVMVVAATGCAHVGVGPQAGHNVDYVQRISLLHITSIDDLEPEPKTKSN